MKKQILFFLVVFFISKFVYSQTFDVFVNGIKENDSVRVIVQKNTDELLDKWVYYQSDGDDVVSFELYQGSWNVSLDATGYTYPVGKNFNFPQTTNVSFTLTPLLNENYVYQWNDDESYRGHSIQTYVNEPTSIELIGDSISIPTDFSSTKLRTDYGLILSNDIDDWSNEDAYRIFKSFSDLPYGPLWWDAKVDFSTGENIKGVISLTEDELPNDIIIEQVGNIKYATISKSALKYALPLIGKLDGIKGKFFSKRLYHVLVRFITNNGTDDDVLNWLAREKYGISFLVPSDPIVEESMEEDSSNFQEFSYFEKLEILSMIEELPSGFHKQNELKYVLRRIDGQRDYRLITADAIAFTGKGIIEFMSFAFDGDLSAIRRLILHEKAHFLWAHTFNSSIKTEWIEIGDWFEDPSSPSGWLTSNTSEFVSAYAHLKNPDEDMAESIAAYLTNPDLLMSRSFRKYEFIRDRIMHGSRYIAQIREDLTFTVYNLYPDYTLPGKVVSLNLEVINQENGNKTVNMKVKMKSDDPSLDGASFGYARFLSSIGTVHDIQLSPENGTLDSVLLGGTTFNKFEKSGYWRLQQLRITDQVGNERFENVATIGSKLYIENPDEDITPPKFNNDLQMDLVRDKFNIDGTFWGNLSEEGDSLNAIRFRYSFEEKNLINYGSYIRIKRPNNLYGGGFVESRGETITPDSINKKFDHYLVIPDFYPSGYYATTYQITKDEAQNFSYVIHVSDPDDFYIDPSVQPPNTFKFLRDSIYVESKYPDLVKPEIDINNITITAEPTNPTNPDGETRVDIEIIARDLSDFVGKESGVYKVSLSLRDPQGNMYSYQTGNSTMNHPDLPDGVYKNTPSNNNDWGVYRFNLLLPRGSPPGTWGLADATVMDLAGNKKLYSFVEYVRFDLIESSFSFDQPLDIEILDRVINANNVNSIDVSIDCTPCQGINYIMTIYSRYGGGSVVRSTGVLQSNSNIIQDIDTEGVLDGEINLTVQLLDEESNLISQKSVQYTKDVVYPSSYLIRSNLQDQGVSNLDDLVIDVEFNVDEDLNGTFIISEGLVNLDESFNFIGKTEVVSSTGVLSDNLSSRNTNLIQLDPGIVFLSLEITDPNGNKSLEPYYDYYIRIDQDKVKKYFENDNDFDDDGILNNFDLYPFNSSNDVDNDGVTDDMDQCPDTRQGVIVDIRGCEIFNLPQNNYRIEVISSSCRGENDGSISINLLDQELNYSLRVNGENSLNFNGSSGFNQTIDNLSPGQYTLCFTVEGESGYYQCFDINITEPAPLSASSKVDKEGKSMSFSLDGSDRYTIVHNGVERVFDISNPEIPLKKGVNFIEVKTDKPCQGTYTEEVFISEKVEFYPNPTIDVVNLYIHGKDKTVDLKIVDRDGNIVGTSCRNIQSNRKIQVNLGQYPKGVYLVQCKGETVQKTIKIIRE